jgi:glycosyltransferase involved in cell wall biosynthesis
MALTTVCYVSAAAANWGGASRVLFTNLKSIDRERFRPVVLLPAEGPITEELDRLAIPYEIWGKHHDFEGVWSYVRAVLASIRMLRRWQVDILHFNHANYWKPAEVIAARLLGVPIITHYHVTVTNPAPWIRYSEAIAIVSQYSAEHSGPEHVPKRVVHNAVDLQRFGTAASIREELGLRSEDVVFSFVGQIREIKGVETFIRVAHAIKDTTARFLIAGECRNVDVYEGSYTQERLKQEIAGDSRIRYLGYRADVEAIYASTDILIVPSRWQEPFGLINIEAGAAGLPVIASRVGGIPEIINDGDNGFLFDKDDFDTLLDHANCLLTDETLRKQVGARARQVVEERFTRRPLQQLEALYDEVLGKE